MKKQMIQDLVNVGLMAAVIAVAMPDLSLAQTYTDLGATTKDLANKQLSSIPNLIAAGCYIMGIIMMVGGTLKLRQHSENPSQTPLSHGLGRVAVGGSIAALPSLMGWINSSTMISGTKLSFDSSLKSAF